MKSIRITARRNDGLLTSCIPAASQMLRLPTASRPRLEDIAELKRTRERNIGVFGSITLCHALLHAGLVDEIRLFTYPRVRGKARRLFPDGLDLPLRLVDATSFANGQIMSVYRTD